jgi:hypothetical protein
LGLGTYRTEKRKRDSEEETTDHDPGNARKPREVAWHDALP